MITELLGICEYLSLKMFEYGVYSARNPPEKQLYSSFFRKAIFTGTPMTGSFFFALRSRDGVGAAPAVAYENCAADENSPPDGGLLALYSMARIWCLGFAPEDLLTIFPFFITISVGMVMI